MLENNLYNQLKKENKEKWVSFDDRVRTSK